MLKSIPMVGRPMIFIECEQSLTSGACKTTCSYWPDYKPYDEASYNTTSCTYCMEGLENNHDLRSYFFTCTVYADSCSRYHKQTCSQIAQENQSGSQCIWCSFRYGGLKARAEGRHNCRRNRCFCGRIRGLERWERNERRWNFERGEDCGIRVPSPSAGPYSMNCLFPIYPLTYRYPECYLVRKRQRNSWRSGLIWIAQANASHFFVFIYIVK